MKRTLLYDVIFYIAMPYLVWIQGRDIIGDYYAMLFSTVPALLYTVIRFMKEKQFNVTGLFIMLTLLIGTVIDLFSGSAENMLINGVYFSLGVCMFFLITMLMKRPMALYFFVDTAFLMGNNRKDSLTLYTKEGLFHYFQWLTGLFVLRGVCQAGVKAYLINRYGVDGYDQMIIIMQVISWSFTFILMIAIFFINQKISSFVDINKIKIETINHF